MTKTLADDGLLLDTEHPYTVGNFVPETFKVWMYCAVVALSNTETDVFSDTGTRLSSSLPLVQVTLVAGPPVEIQVRTE